MALDVTVGGEDANSYVTALEADDYFANHWSAAKLSLWLNLSAGQKEAVLKRACQILDSLRVLDLEIGYGSALPYTLLERGTYDLTLHRLEVGQRLNFPRNIDVDTSNTSFIPQNVKDAQCEQAVHLLAIDEDPLNARFLGVSEETTTAGPVRIRQVFKGDGSMFAPMALELMREFIRPTRRMLRA